MILLIDNYDSFSYNLYQLIGAVEPDIKVVRNDECTLEEIAEMKPEAIILSPGPGRPEDARICRKNPYPGCVPGTSVHLRSLWRNSFLCKRADAWKEKIDV